MTVTKHADSSYKIVMRTIFLTVFGLSLLCSCSILYRTDTFVPAGDKNWECNKTSSVNDGRYIMVCTWGGNMQFKHGLGNGDTIVITPVSESRELLMGFPILPIFPAYSFGTLVTDDQLALFSLFKLDIKGRGDSINYSSLDISVRAGDSLIRPKESSRYLRGCHYRFDYSYKKKNGYRIQISNLRIGGEVFDLPPLVLRRKRILQYVPFAFLAV